MKRLMYLILTSLFCVVLTSESVLADSDINSNLEYTPRIGFNIKITKTNVRKRYEWSQYYRLSDNIRTGAKGGSISANRSLSFGTTVSGSIQGLNIGASNTVTTTIGYTLNVSKNQNKYMAYRVLYEVEEGTRIVSDGSGVISRNRYVVRKPIRGEYSLR